MSRPQLAQVQMPNVFVVPPDEDESPAWCFFDANQPDHPSSLDSPQDDAPSFVFPPRRAKTEGSPHPASRETISVVDSLLEDDCNRAIPSDIDSEDEEEEELVDTTVPLDSPTTPNSPSDAMQNGAEDSLVVEVFKVKHIRQSHEQQMEGGTTGLQQSEPKRTKTLKSRASRVFRSIRGTIRSSSKTRHHQEPVPSDVPPVPPLPPLPPVPTLPMQASAASSKDTLPRPGPTVSRRASTILSLFKTPSLKSQPSTTSFHVSAPVSSDDLPSYITPPSPTHESPSMQPRESNASSSHRLSVYDAEIQDESRLRAASPTPTTASTKSARRRFSVLSLQKLFTLPSSRTSSNSAPPTTSVDDDDGEQLEHPPRPLSRAAPSASSSVTTASSSVPQTPTSLEDSVSVCIADHDERMAASAFHNVLEGGFGTSPQLNLALDLDEPGGKSPQLDTPRAHRSYRTLGNRTPQGMTTPKKQQRYMSAPETPTARKVRRGAASSSAGDDGDVSFEMKLDSLHFDELSFDAGRFSLSSP